MLFELTRRDLPECYKLRFCEETAAIALILEPNVAGWLARMLKKNPPHIKWFAQNLKIGAFSEDIEKPWGYGSVAEPTKAFGEWPAWQMPLPPTIREDGPIDWKRAYEISATLWLAFDLLHLEDNLPTQGTSHQFLDVSLCTQVGVANIFCNISPRATDLLDRLDQADLDLIEQAMRSAYKRMDAKLNRLESFNVMLKEKGFIYLEVPGDACGLGTGFNSFPGEGVSLTPHNVDSPIQQLSLLAGIAALDSILWDKALQTP